jgi:hypothetical protein
MNLLKPLSYVGALLMAGAIVLVAGADTSGPRQYYSSWRKHSGYNYYYRTYYYKPTPTYAGYRHHYVIYYPSRPKYVYYYNPYRKNYWGRCPTSYAPGKPRYSELASEDRRDSLEEIPEKAFPALGPMPRVPESRDEAVMEPPPDDLPTAKLPGK